MPKEELTKARNELYKEQFNMLSIGTTEYPFMIDFFQTEIFPELPSMKQFLDVGCGRGNYAKPFSELFDNTTIVEINDIFFDEVYSSIRGKNLNITGYNADWLDVSLGDVTLDFVLMSHVLYYVDVDKRLQFIRKGYDALKSGGCLVIVLNSEGCGIRKVYKEFYPTEQYLAMPYGEEIAKMLRGENYYPNIEEKVFSAEITVASHHDMEILIDFLLLRQIPFETEEAICQRSHYIEKNLLKDDKYIMDSEGTMVILRKP